MQNPAKQAQDQVCMWNVTVSVLPRVIVCILESREVLQAGELHYLVVFQGQDSAKTRERQVAHQATTQQGTTANEIVCYHQTG
jgi:hypothetical protein